jgi:hypothetical protein
MIMSGAQTANVMEILGATLTRSGLSTRGMLRQHQLEVRAAVRGRDGD